MIFQTSSSEFCIMSLNISFEDKTTDKYMIVVTITVVDGKSVKVHSKVVSGKNEESLMIVAMRVMPYIKNPVTIHLGSILEFLCKEYSYFSPSEMIKYFDQDCNEEVKTTRYWISQVQVNRDFIRVDDTNFFVEDFVMELKLNRQS
jgi:hypothetical protein